MYRVTAQMYGEDGIAITIPDEPVAESAREAAVSPEQGNVIAFHQFFVYLDVGRWGGASDRYFGVIYGDAGLTYVAICEYASAGSYIDILPHIRDEHLTHPVVRTVLGFLNDCSARVVDGWGFQGLVNTEGKLYLLLGDVHLPVYAATRQPPVLGASSPPCRIDGNYIRHIQQTPSERTALENILASGILSPLDGGRTDLTRINEVDGWRSQYARNDIFTVPSSNAPAEDLHRFVRLARGWEDGEEGLSGATDNPRVPIHFIQLGDMYELWVGLRRLFAERSDPVLELRPPPLCDSCRVEPDICPEHSSGGVPVTAESVIRQWVDCVHQTTRWPAASRPGLSVTTGLAEGLGGCGFTRQTWLYGNHDNYLALLHRQLGLDERHPNFFDDGILVEHGHAGDEYNRDGAAGGHAVTQCGAFVWNVRTFTNFDFVRTSERRKFLRHATRQFIAPRYLFRIYAMAHTHHTYLATVTLQGPV